MNQATASGRVGVGEWTQPVRVLASTRGGLARRAALAGLSAVLLVASLPAPDLGFVAWGALVPLLLALDGAGVGLAAALGWGSGVLAAVGVFGWVFEVSGFAWYHAALLAGYLALYPAAWCAGLAWLARRGVPLLASAPGLWVALEWLRGHAGFLALPWGTLAQTQHADLPLLQLASVAGEPGIAFLVVLANAGLYTVLCGGSRRSALAVASAVALAHAAGAWLLSGTAREPALRVAAVQPAFAFGDEATTEGLEARTERLAELTRGAAADAPVLIAWPESALRSVAGPLAPRLSELAREVDASLVIGSAGYQKFRPRLGDDRRARVRSYNMAYHVAPGRPLGEPYRKMRLVPFAEYLPLRGRVPWPERLVPGIYDLTPGEERRLFASRDVPPFAVLICWENLFADFVRPAVRDGARLLVHLANDSWFGRSAQPRQHALASVLRAVENRVPVILASNTGPSRLIDATGRVRAELPAFSAGVLTADLPLGAGPSFYTRFGDWFVAAALLPLGVVLVRSRRHQPPQPAPPSARVPEETP